MGPDPLPSETEGDRMNARREMNLECVLWFLLGMEAGIILCWWGLLILHP